MEKKLPYEGPLVEVVYLCVEGVICGSNEGGSENMDPTGGSW